MAVKTRKRKIKRIIPLLFLLVVVVIGVVIFVNKDNKKENKPSEEAGGKTEEPVPVKKEITIVDVNSDSRNVAVMYNNIVTVWDYQAGLQDAYIVYEIIVEGGYTRLMALFKDQTTERIGSVRSSRPYFLDYALENDALYVHFGGSDQALSDIKILGINNMNGMSYGSGFWRDKTLGLATEHTAFTSMERIMAGADYYNYSTTTSKELLLDYTADTLKLSSMEGAKTANSVYMVYSNSRSTSFEYDEATKLYKRFQGTSKANYVHKDYVTGEQYTAKNIITYQVHNYNLDSYGRQALDNIGSGTGWYISEGYAVPITWEKTSRTSQTVYKYLDGTELVVNDGNTYIQIQPEGKTLTIE